MPTQADLFALGKSILGPQAGGLVARLLACKDHNIAAAHDALEQAAGKRDPRGYVGAMVRRAPIHRGKRGDDWW